MPQSLKHQWRQEKDAEHFNEISSSAKFEGLEKKTNVIFDFLFSTYLQVTDEDLFFCQMPSVYFSEYKCIYSQ